MNRFTIALAGALLAAAPTVAGAQGSAGADSVPKGESPSATERLQEGATAIVEGLRLLMDQLQSYQPPEILPNGDIIIRRRSPDAEPSPEAKPSPEKDAPKDGEDKPLRL